MQDFISLYSKIQNPTLEMVVFSLILAFLCASLIAFTYYQTSRHSFRTPSYVQSLILSALIIGIILQSIGDNMASGLGIFGALHLINFRTNFRDPRDIIFMFAAMGVGISCGSYMFAIAILGTLMFCLLAILLQYSPFYLSKNQVWEIRLRAINGEVGQEAEQILEQFCRQVALDAIRNETNREQQQVQEKDYVIMLKDEKMQKQFLKALETTGLSVRKFNKQPADYTFSN